MSIQEYIVGAGLRNLLYDVDTEYIVGEFRSEKLAVCRYKSISSIAFRSAKLAVSCRYKSRLSSGLRNLLYHDDTLQYHFDRVIITRGPA